MGAAIPVVWLALAVLGLALALISLVDSVQDFLVTRPSNGFRALSIGDIAQESIRLTLYFVFAGLGIWYIAEGREITNPTTGWLMVGSEGLLILKTVIQLVVRRYIRTHGGRNTIS